ncbi:MAG: glutamine amidotransferase [Gammaproteobacteria bacterium]
MKTALVLQHLAYENIGNLAPVLIERGYEIHTVQAGVDDFKKLGSVEPDLLVILGGPIGVYDVELFPFLREEIQLIKTRLEKKLPTLGICLGSQLIAHALGAKVFAGPEKEIGWKPLTLTDAAKKSFFIHLDKEAFKVMQWHGDTFDLPSAATLLASTDLYPNQAYTIDDFALGLQFHLEVLPENFELWLIGSSSELSHLPNMDIPTLREEGALHGRLMQPQAIKFWHAWLDWVEKK